MTSKARGAHRWPLLATTGTGTQPSRARVVAIGGGILLLGCAAAPGLPLALRVALGVLASGLLAFGAFYRRTRERPAEAHLVADGNGLVRVSAAGAKPIAAWDAPFGVTLLASYGRPRGVLAFTTATQTRYVPTQIDGRTDLDDALFARIAVLADLDLVDGIAHEPALTTEAAAELLRHVEEQNRDALGRVYLSDGRGAPIAFDRGTLSVGRREFDLTSQLEWRPLMFHESTGQAAALYQATWIRQNGAEVVLVAPMPASIVPREPNAHKEASGRLGRTLTRDLRLLQSPAEPPPARDIRVSIDRPFMLLVRRVLDEAPRALRVVLPVPKEPRAEGRDSVS